MAGVSFVTSSEMKELSKTVINDFHILLPTYPEIGWDGGRVSGWERFKYVDDSDLKDRFVYSFSERDVKVNGSKELKSILNLCR